MVCTAKDARIVVEFVVIRITVCYTGLACELKGHRYPDAFINFGP